MPSSPRVDADLAAKYNFTDSKDSGPPNSTSKSQAVDVDLDFEHDRITIIASWRTHANLPMLFVRRTGHPCPVFLVEK